ncbi:eukaryotic translation initiation factor 2-alpha kinase 1 isoform X2 [Heptranchias perlo]|uniref:eukaryotic translation initiation factor 2-alpha kinase 1 isoform X2 n=1 Tax=Heptranchias perlo TaxID=212740 RepID=UPI00355AA317
MVPGPGPRVPGDSEALPADAPLLSPMLSGAGWSRGSGCPGVFPPRDTSDDTEQPRAKLAISFPQEGPAAFDESDLLEECGLADCNRTVPTLMDFTVAVPNQLLLVSLLEHLCFVYERNPQRSTSLFKLLCQKLAGMHLISPITFSDELSTVRLQHNQAFTNLLQAASNGLYQQGHATNGDVPTLITSRAKETLFQGQTSRYVNEFEEISRVGKGGYGNVYKVRNKLDRQFYAMKKILMKKVTKYDCMKVLREVKVLAGLQHPHVVGYHTAWMEHTQPPPLRSNRMPCGNLCALKGPSGQEDYRDPSIRNTETSGSSIIFADSGPFARMGETLSGRKPAEEETCMSISKENDNVISFHNEDYGANHLKTRSRLLAGVKGLKVHSSPFYSKSVSVHSGTGASSELLMSPDKRNKLDPLVEAMEADMQDLDTEQEGVTGAVEEISGSSVYVNSSSSSEDGSSFTDAYPESKLCEGSLQDWILERNTRQREGSSHTCPFNLVEPDCTSHIFRQLLEGVRFIHSKGVMHRDLKPRNIFLHGPDYHVRIGDFGLACSDIIVVEASDPWSATAKVTNSKHTSGVGTRLYASPEQLRGSHYDFKSDMYSVGIILLELFQPFGTQMERTKTLTALREGHIAEDFTHRWPVQSKYIKMLTSETASHRPSADEMLGSDLFYNSLEVTPVTSPQGNLEQKVVTQEQEIKSLQQKIIDQNEEIRNLKDKVKLLAGEGVPG